jgi:hypothetical protein
MVPPQAAEGTTSKREKAKTRLCAEAIITSAYPPSFAGGKGRLP